MGVTIGTVGPCRAFERLELCGACVVFERFGGFSLVLYFLFVGSLSLALEDVSTRVAGMAIAALTFKKGVPNASRVATGLEAQERTAGWQSAGYILERPPVPQVSAAALAKGMDAAETHPLPWGVRSNELPVGTRVAGWAKRINAKTATSVADESSGSIILRSLRMEM
jgi:hypothetical protein